MKDPVTAGDVLNAIVAYHMTAELDAEEAKAAQAYMAVIMKRANAEFREVYDKLTRGKG